MKPLSLVNLIVKELKPFLGNSSLSEAEWILMDVMGIQSRSQLYLSSLQMNEYSLNRIYKIINLRKRRIPLQYILGYSYFYGLKFFLSQGVFIPRPETEVIVEYVLKNFNKKLCILEIGTGCGNISISLTKKLSECKIIATDISDEALKWAKYNSFFHRVEKKILLIKADKFNFLKKEEFFDLIISNPPYIRNFDMERLDPEVRKEPLLALHGGRDGCEFIRELIKEGLKFIKRGGEIIIEIGFGEKDLIANFLESNYSNITYKFLKDFDGKDRVLVIRNG